MVSTFSTQVVRLFGWSILAVLSAYLINNVLMLAVDFPVLSLGDGLTGAGAKPLLTYGATLGLAFLLVVLTPNTELRADSDAIHRFNLYLIRACFWSVLFVGIVDAGLAFMRVENLLGFLGQDLVRSGSFAICWALCPCAADCGRVCAGRIHAHLGFHLAGPADCGGRIWHRAKPLRVFIRTGADGRSGALLVCGVVFVFISLHPL